MRDPEQLGAPVRLQVLLPAPAELEEKQHFLLQVIQDCQSAGLRGLRTLRCSKHLTSEAILNILGHLERFRDGPLTLALALEAFLHLSTMRPNFTLDMRSAIVHSCLKAILQVAEEEEDREELKRHFQRLLGGLLMEAPSAATLLHLLNDLRGYALGDSGEEKKLAASSIVALLAFARRFPDLRRAVVRPELACLWRNSNEDDLIIEDL